MTAFISGLSVTDELLGRGHFGSVYLGTDDVHGPVAVKIVRNDPSELARLNVSWERRKTDLLGEGKNLRKADHQNVVKVYYIAEATDGDSVALVMQLCRRGSLQARFDEGPMSLRDLRRISTAMCFGLQALHAAGLLHRDIKPANVLIDDTGAARLSDFGLVTDDLVLGYGSTAGYSDHLAPEVWAGFGTSVKTDIWALGMTIYRLLHGARWYAECPRPQHLIPKGGFAGKLRWLPHVPERWRRTIRQALRDDPGGRFQTAGEFLSALAALPVEPDWQCAVTPDLVSWQKRHLGRNVHVNWDRAIPKEHSWLAWSEPVGVGKRRRLAGSSSVLPETAIVRQLQDFFKAKR